MVESQSRYAIMAELNEKKLKIQQELTDAERQLEKDKRVQQNAIDGWKNKLSSKEATYVADHEVWKKKRELDVDMLIKEKERQAERILANIATADESYIERFELWKIDIEKTIASLTNDMEIVEKDAKSVINAKKAILTELDKGIESLKEISKDQKTD